MNSSRQFWKLFIDRSAGVWSDKMILSITEIINKAKFQAAFYCTVCTCVVRSSTGV